MRDKKGLKYLFAHLSHLSQCVYVWDKWDKLGQEAEHLASIKHFNIHHS